MIDIETSQAIQKQMLDKMETYRNFLRDVRGYLTGESRITSSELLININRELSINPKWEVLENLPHGIPMFQDPNIYKEIDQ